MSILVVTIIDFASLVDIAMIVLSVANNSGFLAHIIL